MTASRKHTVTPMLNQLRSNAAALPSWQRRALAHLLDDGAQPFARAIPASRQSSPEAFLAVVTAKALGQAGFVTIAKERMRLTPRGWWYARAIGGRGT